MADPFSLLPQAQSRTQDGARAVQRRNAPNQGAKQPGSEASFGGALEATGDRHAALKSERRAPAPNRQDRPANIAAADREARRAREDASDAREAPAAHRSGDDSGKPQAMTPAEKRAADDKAAPRSAEAERAVAGGGSGETSRPDEPGEGDMPLAGGSGPEGPEPPIVSRVVDVVIDDPTVEPPIVSPVIDVVIDDPRVEPPPVSEEIDLIFSEDLAVPPASPAVPATPVGAVADGKDSATGMTGQDGASGISGVASLPGLAPQDGASKAAAEAAAKVDATKVDATAATGVDPQTAEGALVKGDMPTGVALSAVGSSDEGAEADAAKAEPTLAGAGEAPRPEVASKPLRPQAGIHVLQIALDTEVKAAQADPSAALSAEARLLELIGARNADGETSSLRQLQGLERALQAQGAPGESLLSANGYGLSQAPGMTLAGTDRLLAGLPATPEGAQARPTPMQMVPIEIGMQAAKGNTQFQIRLDPAELGRIDVTLEINDQGEVQASLVVDRVDTLQMLRRDASTLQQALEQAGLRQSSEGLSFSLRGEDQHQGREGRDQSSGKGHGTDDAIPAQAQVADAALRRMMIPNSRIDLVI